jgi:hypothetical protein
LTKPHTKTANKTILMESLIKNNRSSENFIKEKNSVIESYAKENGLNVDNIKQAIDGYKKLSVGSPLMKIQPHLNLTKTLEVNQQSKRSKGLTPEPSKDMIEVLAKRPDIEIIPRREKSFHCK